MSEPRQSDLWEQISHSYEAEEVCSNEYELQSVLQVTVEHRDALEG